jgi:acyl carrier protein
MPNVDPKLLEHVKRIIRRDLKLGDDIQIADDMPFFESNVDLDSLDMLLMVTSIEKEFGIKIPNEAVGKDVFKNVTTLAQYIQDHMNDRQTSADPLSQLLARLPHREPFRFVSRLAKVGDGEAEGVWSVTGDEPFFAGHFPGHPTVPGVLIAEALAQLSGLLAAASNVTTKHGKLAHVDVRFDEAVAPPAEITLHSKLVRAIGALLMFDVGARVGEKSVARGSLTVAIER